MSLIVRRIEAGGMRQRVPSVQCPHVLDVEAAGHVRAWIGAAQCLACAHCRHIQIDMRTGFGEVECDAE